jgi:hypothetical protein
VLAALILSFVSAGLGPSTGLVDENKYDLNAGKCKYISFSRGSKPVMFQYVIGDSDFELVDVINDLYVYVALEFA